MMPREWLLREKLVADKGVEKAWTDEELEALGLRFGASPEAVLRRLLTLGRTTQKFYDSKRPVFQAFYDQLEQKKEESEAARRITCRCSASLVAPSPSSFSRAITIIISPCVMSQAF